MEFILLVIVNIFLGAIFYLVISLKLEKSATEFREKRLRKEMGEIMKEFNLAAERNITLLENKINVLKKMLELSGTLKSVDFTVGFVEEIKIGETAAETAVHKPAPEVFSSVKRLKERLLDFAEIILMFLYGLIQKLQGARRTGFDREFGRSLSDVEEVNQEKYSIEKDLTSAQCSPEPGESPGISDEEISILVSSGDRLAVVSALHERGFMPDSISRYSGIPVAEINLILNLHLVR